MSDSKAFFFFFFLLFVFLADNPNLVSRVVVAIETLDQNDNAPELDREYTTSVCDSSAPGQVCSFAAFVWVLKFNYFIEKK